MDYIYIRAWGQFMESQSWYIKDQVAMAHEDKAPGNAIHKHDDGTWATINDVTNPLTRRQVDQMAAVIQKRHNPRDPDFPPREIR